MQILRDNTKDKLPISALIVFISKVQLEISDAFHFIQIILSLLSISWTLHMRTSQKSLLHRQKTQRSKAEFLSFEV